MRVADRRELDTLVVDEVDRVALVEPAILDRLLVQRRTRIGCGQRYLYRVRIDLFGEFDRLFDRFGRLARQAQNERAVNQNSELAAVFAESPRNVGAQALLDVV